MRDERGQALVEFAMIVPVFMLLLIGAVDFGRAFNYKNDITALANSAARYAEVNQCGPCAPNQSINNYIVTTADSGELQHGGGGFGIVNGVSVSFCFPSGTHNQGDPLKATVTANYAWLPYLHLGNITISSSETVRLAATYNGNSSDAFTAAATC